MFKEPQTLTHACPLFPEARPSCRRRRPARALSPSPSRGRRSARAPARARAAPARISQTRPMGCGTR